MRLAYQHPSSEELIKLAFDEALKSLNDVLSFVDDNIDAACLRPGRRIAFLAPRNLTKRDQRRHDLIVTAIKTVRSARE